MNLQSEKINVLKDLVSCKIPFIQLPREFVFDSSLSYYSKLLYINFYAHTNSVDGRCFPSDELQAKECQISLKKVWQGRKELIEKGYIQKILIRNENGTFSKVIQWNVLFPCTETSVSPVSAKQAKNTTTETSETPVPVNGRSNDNNLNNLNYKNETKIADDPKQTKKASSADSVSNSSYKEKKHINEIFHLFESYTGWIPNFKNKTERESVNELLARFNLIEIAGFLDLAQKYKDYQYAPKIMKPSELLSKLNKLKEFHKQKQESVLIIEGATELL